MKIITGGVAKSRVADALRPYLKEGETVEVGTDMDAAIKLRKGVADYYLGTCHTGAGASLGVLLSFLGSDKTHTFGRKVPSKKQIREALCSGKIAFGFSIDQIEEVVPLIISELRVKGNKDD